MTKINTDPVAEADEPFDPDDRAHRFAEAVMIAEADMAYRIVTLQLAVAVAAVGLRYFGAV